MSRKTSATASGLDIAQPEFCSALKCPAQFFLAAHRRGAAQRKSAVSTAPPLLR
jgi:hypothetical protein